MDLQNRTTSFIYDYNRTNTFENYIKANVSGKTVVDCGAGSGILTYLSAINGATKVYCLEKDQDIYDNLVTTFNSNTNVEVQKFDCFTETFPVGDIYLHEFFGSFLWDEDVLSLISNFNNQSITNIFPENINIFSGTKDFKYFDKRISYNYNNLSSDVKDFLPQEDWYPTVYDEGIYNYEYINIEDKITEYSGSILSLNSTYESHKLWEVITEYGTISNLNTEFSCWPINED